MSQQSMPARRGQARILSITAALLCMLVTIFALRLSTQTEEGFGLGDYSGVSAQACLAAFEESGDSGDLVQLLKVLCYQAVVEGDEAAQPLIRQYGTLLCHAELMGMTNSFTAMAGLVDALAMLYSFTSDSASQEEKAGRDALQQMFDSCFDKQNTSI